ncbi:MAG: pentapeptide repeat-containing protein [Promethearchaeota archaeon]
MKNRTIAEIFPLADQSGSDFSDIDIKHQRILAEESAPITPTAFQTILSNHQEFLKAGGRGGDWQTMNINGVILGIYIGPKVLRGEQAVVNNQRLDQINMKESHLPYANLVGILAENCDWGRCNINHSLMTDTMCRGTNFEAISAIGTDFSRSDLRGCNFSGANLKYADFENCQLDGADFTNAILTNARFPGANLKNVIH